MSRFPYRSMVHAVAVAAHANASEVACRCGELIRARGDGSGDSGVCRLGTVPSRARDGSTFGTVISIARCLHHALLMESGSYAACSSQETNDHYTVKKGFTVLTLAAVALTVLDSDVAQASPVTSIRTT